MTLIRKHEARILAFQAAIAFLICLVLVLSSQLGSNGQQPQRTVGEQLAVHQNQIDYLEKGRMANSDGIAQIRSELSEVKVTIREGQAKISTGLDAVKYGIAGLSALMGAILYVLNATRKKVEIRDAPGP